MCDVQSSVRWVTSAWNNVKPESIQNGFRKAGILPPPTSLPAAQVMFAISERNTSYESVSDINDRKVAQVANKLSGDDDDVYGSGFK